MAQSLDKDLYSREWCSSCSAFDWHFLSHNNRRWLNQTISTKEIKMAVFFKNYGILWNNLSRIELLWIFSNGTMSDWLNDSLLCLIMKLAKPEDLIQVWPISLCNVLVKAILKVLVNRLKLVMGKLIGRCQVSFIMGRSISDNIMVA